MPFEPLRHCALSGLCNPSAPKLLQLLHPLPDNARQRENCTETSTAMKELKPRRTPIGALDTVDADFQCGAAVSEGQRNGVDLVIMTTAGKGEQLRFSDEGRAYASILHENAGWLVLLRQMDGERSQAGIINAASDDFKQIVEPSLEQPDRRYGPIIVGSRFRRRVPTDEDFVSPVHAQLARCGGFGRVSERGPDKRANWLDDAIAGNFTTLRSSFDWD